MTRRAQDFDPGQGVCLQSFQDFLRGDFVLHFQLDNFLRASDAQRKGKGKDETGMRIEALRPTNGKLGPPDGPLEKAQQIVMADEPKVAAFAKANADFAVFHAHAIQPCRETPAAARWRNPGGPVSSLVLGMSSRKKSRPVKKLKSRTAHDKRLPPTCKLPTCRPVDFVARFSLHDEGILSRSWSENRPQSALPIRQSDSRCLGRRCSQKEQLCCDKAARERIKASGVVSFNLSMTLLASSRRLAQFPRAYPMVLGSWG